MLTGWRATPGSASPTPTTTNGRVATPASTQPKAAATSGLSASRTLVTHRPFAPSPAPATQPVPSRAVSASQSSARLSPFNTNGAQLNPKNPKPDLFASLSSGALSPYGHSLADAPETSALLAELEQLERLTQQGTLTQQEKVAQQDGLNRVTNAMGMTDPAEIAATQSLLAHGAPPFGYGAAAGPSTSSLPSTAPIGGSQYSMPNGAASMPGSSSQPINKGKAKAISPAKPKPPAEPIDKRPCLMRKKPPISVQERADRVRSQRMFMVHQSRDPESLHATMHVLGSTGNIYTVEFGALPTCTCPDYAKGSHCKHIIFVALKVLRMSERGTLWYQKGYTKAELRAIFAKAPPNAFNSVAAPANVQQAFREHAGLEPAAGAAAGSASADGQKRKPAKGDECPICADAMKDEGRGADELVYDLGAGGCGKGVFASSTLWKVTDCVSRP